MDKFCYVIGDSEHCSIHFMNTKARLGVLIFILQSPIFVQEAMTQLSDFGITSEKFVFKYFKVTLIMSVLFNFTRLNRGF